jgi:pyruvate dehydrogenase E2 component (dihydrolipoamide acetyltransferase)
MPIDILVPPLSQTMDSLLIVEWVKRPGDQVTKGETLLLVETDKATLEVESPASGILHEVFAGAGADVKIKSRIGTILAAGESRPAPAPVPAPLQDGPGAAGTPGPASVRQQGTAAAAAPIPGEQLPAERSRRIFASPRARRLAGDNSIALPELASGSQPSGPRGMFVSRDVLAYLEARQSRTRVTPLARRVAEDLGVDLAALAGSQPGQVITRADVEALDGAEAAARPAPEPGAESEVQTPDQALPTGRPLVLSNLRRTIARRMLESHQTTAPVTLTRDVNATRLRALREQLLGELGPGAERPSYTDFLAFIVTRCLLRHPALNGVAAGDGWQLADEVHLSVAVDTERGLVVPVIRSAQRKGLLELAAGRRDLAERARRGSVKPEDLAGGTFTITNLGPLGVDAFTPIINPPQIAILGVGRMRTVPSYANGQVVPADMLYLSLTFDHRAVDGAPAARLLADIAGWIEQPVLIWFH